MQRLLNNQRIYHETLVRVEAADILAEDPGENEVKGEGSWRKNFVLIAAKYLKAEQMPSFVRSAERDV